MQSVPTTFLSLAELILLTPNSPFPNPISTFPKGAALLVDKPLGWTSFDVVNKIRWHLSKRLGVKRIKIGHAGTLDPLATGLLILCVGDYTKRIEELQALSKEYTGTVTFGATTPSFDLEKPINATFPIEHLDDDKVKSVRSQFMGEIDQVPPIYSAVKVDGKRLYKNARTGEEVEIEPRKVRIDELEIGSLRPVSMDGHDQRAFIVKGNAPIALYPDYEQGLQADFRVLCGKGTYIRSLANDLGIALETGAYLSALRRTRIGDFLAADAWQVGQLVDWIQRI